MVSIILSKISQTLVMIKYKYLTCERLVEDDSSSLGCST